MVHVSPLGETVTRPLVVDTDGGTDDAVALWWALCEPGVEVVAVLATGGNVGRDQAAANVGRVLRAGGRPEVPVALGADAPTHVGGAAARALRSRAVHGHDGLGGYADRWPAALVEPVPEPAAELLARLTCRRPGEIDLVTLGPLTTAAAALRIDPGVATRVRSLTVMAGRLGHGGHTVVAEEANVGHDPPAAAQVLAAPWATVEPPLLVGLDVTRHALLSPDDLAAAAAGLTPAARFVTDPLRGYARWYQEASAVPPGAAPCHDLLAVVAAVDTSVLAEAPQRRLRVEGASGPSGVPWRVALAADVRRFRAAFRALVGVTDLPGGAREPGTR